MINRTLEQRRTCIESLEGRTFLAGSAIDLPTITSRGTLIVTGTNAADRIVVTLKNNQTRVIVKSAEGDVLLDKKYRMPTFKRVAVDAGGGDDLVLVSPAFARSLALYGGAGNDVLFEGSGAAVLDGGDGNDVIGRPGDDTFGNPVTLTGGAGDDLLQPDLTDYADGGIGIDAIGRDTSARTIQTNGIESSSRFVAGVDAAGTLRVTGTDSGEEINIGGRGPLNAEGTREVPTWAEVTAFTPEILWKPLIKVDLTDFSAVVLDGIGGNDDLFVAYEVDKPTTINGGTGDDLVRAFGNAVLTGGPGNDTLMGNNYYGLWSRGGKIVARDGDASALGVVEMLGGIGNDTLLGDTNDILDGGADTDTANAGYVVVRENDDPMLTAEEFEAMRDAIRPQATTAVRAFVGQYITHFNIERVAATITTTNARGYEGREGLVPV